MFFVWKKHVSKHAYKCIKKTYIQMHTYLGEKIRLQTYDKNIGGGTVGEEDNPHTEAIVLATVSRPLLSVIPHLSSLFPVCHSPSLFPISCLSPLSYH